MTPVVGVCPVISAIFDSDGVIDLVGFRAVAEMIMSSGASSLMVFGVATENAKLSDEERELMLEALIDVRGNGGPAIVATVADHSTELAERRLARWIDLGVDVINILPSRFLDPPVDQAQRHLERLLGISTLPIVIQYLPQAGSALSLEAMVSLHQDFSMLRQIKVEEIPAAPAVRLVEEASGGALTSLVGWGGLEWAEAARAGAVGVQPGCSVPELYVRAQRFLDEGDFGRFDEVFEPLRRPLTAWLRHVEVLIAVEKYILFRRGLISSDRCRHPSATLTGSDLELAESVIAALYSESVA